jgi:hypothetical protein
VYVYEPEQCTVFFSSLARLVTPPIARSLLRAQDGTLILEFYLPTLWGHSYFLMGKSSYKYAHARTQTNTFKNIRMENSATQKRESP